MGWAELVDGVDRSCQAHLGGVPVIYRPTVGAPDVVTGIFDAAYVLQQGGAPAGVSATAPAVFLQLADLPSDPEVDDPILTIDDVDYRLDHTETAGMGSIVLVLRKAI